MTDLPSILERARQSLGGNSEIRYPDDLLLEALRQALEEYSRAWPQVRTAALTLAQRGREHNLASLQGLLRVVQVYFPYVDDAVTVTPGEYTLYWVGGAPMLHLGGERLPQAGEKMRVDYTAQHTLEGLDGAASGSVHPEHTGLLVIGAAGHAALMRAAAITEAHGSRTSDSKAVALLGKSRLELFRLGLRQLNKESPPPYQVNAWRGRGWRLDHFDGGEQ